MVIKDAKVCPSCGKYMYFNYISQIYVCGFCGCMDQVFEGDYEREVNNVI